MTMKEDSILGLGTDIIEIARIQESIARHGQHFLDRLFTHQEQEYCLKYKDAAPHFAGRFAAKEAVAKALGIGFGAKLSWLDFEILGDEYNKPTVHFTIDAKERLHQPKIAVSISHSATAATAVAIWFS